MTLPPARDLRLYERRVFLRRVGIALINTLFQMDGRLFHQREDLLKRLRCLLVIEHIGKFLEPVPPHPGFQSLLRLADSGRCWVKLSGAYMLSTAGPPYYPDIGVLAHTRCSGVAPEHLVPATGRIRCPAGPFRQTMPSCSTGCRMKKSATTYSR